MNSQLENKLFKKYPKIFRQKDLSMSQTCMCWGIDCADGWYWLLDALCSHLQFDIDNNNEKQLETTQVKEKFGTLRFYVNHSTEKQQSVINFAEMLSSSICEECGTTKQNVKLRKGSWVRTLCSECAKK